MCNERIVHLSSLQTKLAILESKQLCIFFDAGLRQSTDMFLEWIDQNSLAGSNASDKRKVRSQAMKSFRSRQRAERQAAVTRALDKAARRTEKPRSESGGPLAGQASRKRKRSCSDQGGKNEGCDSAPSRVTPTSHSTALSRMSIPRGPTQWDYNVFRSPVQVDQVIGFCASYLTQIRPLITFEHATAVMQTAWDVSPCPMLLAAGSLAAAGDIEDSCQPEGIFKAKVLHELGERMKFEETAVSDETICALMFLTSFDLSRSNCEARTHLRAMDDILQQRYSSSACIPISYSMMHETLDLIQSLTFDTPPVTKALSTYPRISAWEMAEKLGGLLTIECAVYNAETHPSRLRRLDKLLSSAFASIQAVIINATMGGSIFDSFYESLEVFRKETCRDDPDSPTVHHIARVCYHQQAILYNLVANGRSYRHTSNTSHVQGLVTSIRADAQEHWQSMPFLRLMVLSTGLAASRDANHTAFFKARLSKAIQTIGLERWLEVREFILMLLLGREYLQKVPSQLSRISEINLRSSNPVIHGSSAQTPLEPQSQSCGSEYPSKANRYRSPKVQHLLTTDLTFHNIIRQGHCALIEHT